MEKEYKVSNKLIEWYQLNKRDLPWRETTDPYKIWISEIILQQTRIAQGLDYYNRFMDRFPDIRSLAEAREDEVLKYWQGLGYYSRARNLHAAAKTVVERFDGQFPENYQDILSLKGIGEYTAAAIASFSRNQPYPVVDGNVFRVLSRLFGLSTPIDTGKGKKEFTKLAGVVMDPENAALHNQAIMEFGALHCTPQNPGCLNCTFNDMCVGWNKRSVLSYPVKQNKTKSRNRFFHYFHVVKGDSTWLNRRSGKDIWEGLYEFPLVETPEACDFTALTETGAFRKLFGVNSSLKFTVALSSVKHVLSHQVIYATFYRLEIKEELPGLSSFQYLKSSEIDQYAVSRLTEIYLEKGGQLSFNYTV